MGRSCPYGRVVAEQRHLCRRRYRKFSKTASRSSVHRSRSRSVLSTPRRNHRIPASDGSSLALYRWPQPHGPLCLLQHQLVDFLGFKSFKRKYNTGLTRRKLESKEQLFLVSKRLLLEEEQNEPACAVVLLAEEIVSLLKHEFPKHHQILEKRVNSLLREGAQQGQPATETPRRTATDDRCSKKTEKPIAENHLNHRHERQVTVLPANDVLDESDAPLVSASSFNSTLRIRRQRQCKCLNLQTMQVNYPRQCQHVADPATTRIGAYPVALVQGQFFDGFVRRYRSTELFRLPFNTVILDRPKTPPPKIHAAKPPEVTPKRSPDACTACGETVVITASASASIRCSTCNSVSHTKCLEMDDAMLKVALTYDWQCINCKICSKCSRSSDEEMMMFCDRCDRGFHTYCVGLDAIPEGSWTCTPCLQALAVSERSSGGKHSSDPPPVPPSRKRQRAGDSASPGSAARAADVGPSPVGETRHSLRLLKKRSSRRRETSRRRRRL